MSTNLPRVPTPSLHDTYEISYPPHPHHTTLYRAHINFLYNCFLRIHVQPEYGYCWKAETCSCTLGNNVNTPLSSNEQVVLD